MDIPLSNHTNQYRDEKPAPGNAELERNAGFTWWNVRTRALVGVVLVVAFVWLGRQHFGELSRLADANPWMVIVLIVVFLVARILNTEVMYLALDALDRRIGRFELFLLTFLRTYSSMLVPRAGLGATGVYLKAKHGVSYADAASLVLPMVVLQLVVIGGMGLITQAMLIWTPGMEASWELTAVFAIILTTATAGVFGRVTVSEQRAGKMIGFVRRLSHSWQRLSKNRNVVWRILFVQTLQVLTRALELYVAFRALGVSISPLAVLVSSLLADVMFVISLTPNALGFREAAIVYGASLTGVDAGISLAAAILDRLVASMIVVLCAQFALFRIVRSKPLAN